MKKPIRILNSNFEIQGEIDDYESMFFTRSYSKVGAFELRINRHKTYADVFRQGNIIVVDNNFNKCFMIKHREIELEESGRASETWLIKAYELKTIVSQRITMPPNHTAYDNKSGNAEMVMKHYIDTNIVNPDDAQRKISNFVVATNRNRGTSISHQSRFKNLSEEMATLSLESGLGWTVGIDVQNKMYVFDCLDGKNLTANQTTNPPVIFSPEFDSVKSLKLTESSSNYKNTAVVAGQGEGVNRRVVVIGSDKEGLQRHELYIDARDVAETTDDGTALERTEVEEKLIERGNKQLSELTQEIYLEGQILTNSPFLYENDYDIGDVVTIQNKDWNITMDARITEIKEIYEPNGFRLEATFGSNLPTLIEKIKNEFKQTNVASEGYVTKAELLEEIKKVDAGGGTGGGGTGGEVDLSDYYTKVQVDNGFATKNHAHTGYAPAAHTHAGYAPINHNHDAYITMEDLAEELGKWVLSEGGEGGTGGGTAQDVIISVLDDTTKSDGLFVYNVATTGTASPVRLEAGATIPDVLEIPDYVEYLGTLYVVNLPPQATMLKVNSFTKYVANKNMYSIYALNGASGVNVKEIDYRGGKCCWQTIPAAAFYNNTYLEKVRLPPSLQNIGATSGSGAFQGCTNLVEVDFSGNEYLNALGIQTFKDCTNLRSITLPKFIRTVSNSIFDGCTNLETVVLNDLERLTNYMFKDCTNLKNIDLSKVTRIGSYVFQGCEHLEHASGELVTTLSTYAFQDCTGLISANFPLVVAYSANAFKNCTNLSNIEFGVGNASGYLSVSGNAFENCVALENLDFSKSTTITITNNAFLNCTGLRNVRFCSGKPTIYAASFAGVTGCTFTFQKKSHYTSLSATSTSSFRYWIETGAGTSNTVAWIEEDV